MTDNAELLASKIRGVLGERNDPEKSVAQCVQGLLDTIDAQAAEIEADERNLCILTDALAEASKENEALRKEIEALRAQVPEFAYSSISEFESMFGYTTNESFRTGFTMARMTMAGLGIDPPPSGTAERVCRCPSDQTTGWTTWGGIPLCNVCGLVNAEAALEMGRAALAEKGE